MKKSFKLTLACSVILFASQLSGMNPNDPNNNRWQRNNLQNMNNQNNPSNHSNQQDQPQQNANSNNPQNPRNNDALTISQEEMDRIIDSIHRFEQRPLPTQIPYNNAQGFGYPRHAGRAVDVYNPNNSYSSNQPPMQIPMYFHEQPSMQMPYNAGGANYYGYPQQTYYQQPMYVQITIPPVRMTEDQAMQLWPNGLMDALLSTSSSDQGFDNVCRRINENIRAVSADRMFFPGDSSKNTANDFKKEVDCLELHKQSSQLIDYSLFFIRLHWDLDSPEVKGWKERWEAISGKETEKRKFNGDLNNFIASVPGKIVSSITGQQGQYQQTLEEGFDLLHRVADILRELGLLAQQHQQIPLHFNPQSNFVPNFNPNQLFEYTYQLPTQQVQIPVNLPRNSPIFQRTLESISNAIRMSYSGQEQALALYGFNEMVNEASRNRLFISGNPSKNKLGDLTAEVDYLEHQAQQDFGRVVVSLVEGVLGHSSFDIIKAQNCFFLIRMLWILESPEARDWINHWSQHIQTQNMQDEQQRLDRFNQDLRNFIAQIPGHFVAGPNNQQQEMELFNQSQQLRQTGFSLLHYLTEITRNLNRI